MMQHAAHPLAETLERLGAHSDYLKLQLGAPSGDGWIAAAALSAVASPERARMLQRIASTNQTTDRHVITMSFWTSYTWQVLMSSVAGYLVEQRVPDLGPDNIMLHWNHEGATDQIAIRSGRFTALPSDPAADHGDATIVPDLDALRGVLLDQITRRYIPPMLDVLAAHGPLGRRALWAAVADRCAGTIILAAKLLGAQAECRHEVASLVEQAPLRGKTGVMAVEYDGREELFLQRGACCYSYKLPQHDYCATCPLLPIEERERRLRALMEG